MGGRGKGGKGEGGGRVEGGEVEGRREMVEAMKEEQIEEGKCLGTRREEIVLSCLIYFRSSSFVLPLCSGQGALPLY